MKNMGDYHDHYRKKDVLLLTDVFEKFIGTCLKFYGLDSCHYFSSLGLSWDAMSKMTGVKVGKISDIDKYLFIEKGLRRRISYMLKDMQKPITNTWMIMTLKTVNITYLDMNNFYGWGLSSYIPYGRFKWLKNVDGFDVNSVSAVSSDMLSKYCKKIADKYEIKVGAVKKINSKFR